MQNKKARFSFFYIAVLTLLLTLISSCAFHIKTTASVKPVFMSYDKLALLFQTRQDEIYETFFLSYWMNAFPHQSIVEQKEIRKIINRRDFSVRRLSDRTRAHIRSSLGVKAIVLVELGIERKKRPTPFRPADPTVKTDLSIKVVDLETGEIVVSSLTQGKNRPIESLIVEAIRIIQAKVNKLSYGIVNY